MKFPDCDALLKAALREDGAGRDLTTLAIVPKGAQGRARLRAREAGVMAGGPLLARLYRLLSPRIKVSLKAREGRAFKKGALLATLQGPARALLSGERVALNFLQRLSGIATFTAAFARAARGTRARVFDTRKTTPGLRLLERYAVACGGGMNHRFNLSSAVLIKDNHLKYAGPAEAVRRARRRWPKRQIEVEVDTLAQLRDALAAHPDIVLLDNMLPRLAGAALVAARLMPNSRRPQIEISGGVTLKNIREYARLGVDRISVGALTHSAPALDLALDFD